MASTSHPCSTNSVFKSVRKREQFERKVEKGETQVIYRKQEQTSRTAALQVGQAEYSRGIIYEVPLGSAFNNVFVANVGINVPIRYKLIGDIRGNYVSEVKEYGINNALIEICLEMVYKSRVSVPLSGEEVEEVVKIPLVIKLVQCEIPDYLIGTNFNGGIE